ncbi:hypothetical protein BJ170DRAFT_718998 [Xylariales sp. AK1849]|nr:hypothetical protein BJ170DRAFT_718998 [Xylariales sp. AK1849]
MKALISWSIFSLNFFPLSSSSPSLPCFPPAVVLKMKPLIDGHPPDQIPFKRAKLSTASPADNPPHDQVSSVPSGVFPEPSRSQNRNRRANSPPQDQTLFKTPKSRGAVHRLSNFPSNFPPTFYDNLSRIRLTRRALQELDRRNDNLPPPKLTAQQKHTEDFAVAVGKGGPDLARFARTGGPDLSDLQGYPEPISTAHTMASTSSSVTSKRVSAGSVRTYSTKATTVSHKSKRSSAYDANFGQHCIDHHIYPPTAFEDFQDKNATRSEGTVMRTVVPLITGDVDIPNEGHLPFNNLASITNDTTVNPVPDFFDGAHPGALNKKVGIPVAPNFFLEVKGLGGTLGVAEGQSYFLNEFIYNSKAYIFSLTLFNGYFILYIYYFIIFIKSEKNFKYYII